MSIKKTFLKKIGGFFGVDINYFVDNGKWISSMNITIAILSLLYTVLLSHWLSVESLGAYQFILAFIATISVFSLSGFSTAVFQSASKGFNRSYVDSAKIRFKYSWLGSLIILASTVYFFHIGKIFWPIIPIIALLFPFLFSFGDSIVFLYGFGRYKQGSIIKLISGLIPMIFTAAAAFYSGKIMPCVITYFISLALVNILTRYYISVIVEPELGKPSEDKDLPNYGKKLSLIEALNVVFTYIDKLLLAYVSGFASLAVYYIADAFPNILKAQLKGLYSLLLPKFTKQKPDKSFILKGLILGTFLSLGIVFVSVLIVPWIISWVFPVSYLPAIKYAQILLLSAVTFIPILVIRSYIESQKYVKELFTYKIANPLIGIGIYAIGIIFFGVWGLIIGKVIVSVTSLLFILILARRKIK